MRKIGLIINPHAKKSRTIRGHTESLKKHFPDPTRVWLPTTLDQLSEVTEKILSDKVEILFLSGGDGTFRAVVESFLKNKSSHKLPAFVLLQGGTGGLYSKHYFGTRAPLRHLRKTLKQLQHLDILPLTPINILNVNGRNGFIFAIGGFSNVLSYYMSHKERSISLANWLILRLTISHIFGTSLYKRMFPRFWVQIKDNTQTRSMEVTTIASSSIPVGYILNPFYGVELNKSFSTILIPGSPFRMFQHLNDLIKKQRVVSSNMEQFTSDSIDLLLSHPLQPMVDGDMLDPATEIHVKLGPQINLLTL